MAVGERWVRRLIRVALLVAYGASTATSVVPTLFAIVHTKVVPPLSTGEIAILLSSYIPFLLIPSAIMVDMGIRLLKIINGAQVRKAA